MEFSLKFPDSMSNSEYPPALAEFTPHTKSTLREDYHSFEHGNKNVDRTTSVFKLANSLSGEKFEVKLERITKVGTWEHEGPKDRIESHSHFETTFYR